jgi:hypothetical protein
MRWNNAAKNSRIDGYAAAVLAVSATALNRQMTDR